MALTHNETARTIERLGGYEIVEIKTRTWGDGNVLETSTRFRVLTNSVFWDFTSLEAARRFLDGRLEK